MTFKYDNVYVKDTATIAGPYEKDGPLKKEFDKTFNDLYYKQKSWEKAESKVLEDTINLLLKKSNKNKEDIDVARLTHFALFALQHRGQESCGIAVNDNGTIVYHKKSWTCS